jgi:nitroreductase
MSQVHTAAILEQLNWRYATKKFDSDKKISESNWKALEESVRLAPSSYGLQPWQFLIVQNMDLRNQLTPHTWNQTQVNDCSHYVVLTYKKKMDEQHIQKFIDKNIEVRNVPAANLEGYKNMMINNLTQGAATETIGWWAQRQCYIAMGFLMETAALLNIDTCAIEGLDPAAYDRILKLEDSEYSTVAAVACGYRHADDKYQVAQKVRFDSNEVIKFL